MANLDSKNILNSPLSIAGAKRDLIGLGMSTDKMMMIKLGEGTVGGLVCSTNDLPADM